MAKLVINPNTSLACEYELKPGNNFLGRAFANDVQIENSSVSSSHCNIMVNADSTLIKDLGSTNGTFVNHAQIQEAYLLDGHVVHLGGVEMTFHADAPPRPAVAAVAASPPVPSIRISRAVAPPPAAPPPVFEAPVETFAGNAPVMLNSAKSCKFHPRAQARFLCNKCNRYFCDLCVIARDVAKVSKKMCRTCGVEVVPVHYDIAPEIERGFF